MEIHDEAMERMDEMYSLKRELQEEIANSQNLVIEKRENMERIISNLDSASNAMMVWMRSFDPLPDSSDQEEARQYLETEMDKIKKVRDDVLHAIEAAREEGN